MPSTQSSTASARSAGAMSDSSHRSAGSSSLATTTESLEAMSLHGSEARLNGIHVGPMPGKGEASGGVSATSQLSSLPSPTPTSSTGVAGSPKPVVTAIDPKSVAAHVAMPGDVFPAVSSSQHSLTNLGMGKTLGETIFTDGSIFYCAMFFVHACNIISRRCWKQKNELIHRSVHNNIVWAICQCCSVHVAQDDET